MNGVSDMSKNRKLRIWEVICRISKRDGVPFHVLHGVDGDQIGRDVDVWIEPVFISRVASAICETAKSLDFEVFHINSISGHRFLFFAKESSECGTFEFHCVRNLRWFWVGNPLKSDAAPVWKRIVLPLLSRNCEKVGSELQKHPLSDRERAFLRDNFALMHLLSQSEIQAFFDALDCHDMVSASRRIRRNLMLRAWRHPIGVMQFAFRRLILPFWLMSRPCGPVAIVDNVELAEALRNTVEPRKGILTEVGIIDYSRCPFIFLPLRLFLLRIFRQGRQKATVLVLSPNCRLGVRYLAAPVFWNGEGDPVSKLTSAMKKILQEPTRQQFQISE